MPSNSFPEPFNTVKRFKNLFRVLFCLTLFQPLAAQTLNLTPTLLPTLGLTTTPTLVTLPTATPTLIPSLTPLPTLTPSPTLVILSTATPTKPYATSTPVGVKTTPTDTPLKVGFPAPLYFDSNFFNPLHAPLGIHFKMDSDGQAKILVFNMRGEEVLKLLNEYEPAGTYSLSWNGHNQLNTLVGNGVYLVVFETPAGNTIQKVIVLK
ncbi:MAG TPA: T9SS type A sorting domain-containing protein [bacterium]|nr:T9SS type A sorting domain-containing protein [bacterium]